MVVDFFGVTWSHVYVNGYSTMDLHGKARCCISMSSSSNSLQTNARGDGTWMHRHLLVGVMVFVSLGFVFPHLHYSVMGLLWKPR